MQTKTAIKYRPLGTVSFKNSTMLL